MALKDDLLNKYPCTIPFSCVNINQLKSSIEHHAPKEIVESMIKTLEQIRTANDQLRTWGHEMRVKVIMRENGISEEHEKEEYAIFKQSIIGNRDVK
jgi:hypothetical protein